MDPANRAFMESISRGECPAELDPGNRTQPISVNLVKSEKPYEAPAKPKYKAFSGSGQTLAGQKTCAYSKHQFVKVGCKNPCCYVSSLTEQETACMVVFGLCVCHCQLVSNCVLPLCHPGCLTGIIV